MNPERFLGQDPARSNLQDVDAASAVLRECVIVLAEGRQRLDQLTGPDTVWQGARAAVVVDAITAFVTRIRVLEDAVVDFTRAWQEWRVGVARRQEESAELVETISQIVAEDGGQRASVLRRADALAELHDAAAADTSEAGETLIEVLATSGRAADLPADLSRGLRGLRAAIDQWLVQAEAQMQRATDSVDTVVELTAVVPTLIGVGTRNASSQASVEQMVTRAPGSHRLREALEQTWEPPDPADLPAASFVQVPTRSIGDRVKGIGDRT